MVSLFDNCPACRGTCHIEVRMQYAIRSWLDDDPSPYAPPAVKRYPCPECQTVFYHTDLIQANVQQPLRDEFKQDAGYTQHIEWDLARQLGQLALQHGGVTFRAGEDLGMGFREHVGTAYVVKNTAHGWKK